MYSAPIDISGWTEVSGAVLTPNRSLVAIATRRWKPNSRGGTGAAIFFLRRMRGLTHSIMGEPLRPLSKPGISATSADQCRSILLSSSTRQRLLHPCPSNGRVEITHPAYLVWRCDSGSQPSPCDRKAIRVADASRTGWLG